MRTGKHLPKPGIEERVEVCRTHLMRSIEWKGEKLGIIEMRNHYANYFRGLPDFRDHRMKIVTSHSLQEILDTFEVVKEKYAQAV
jgi:tRNA-dihydrouridine synthase